MKAQVDALSKYRNQLLSVFNAQQLAEMKRSNWSGLLEQTDQLYATMYHDWDVLQKDSNDMAEAVQTLEWSVAPYVADGEDATPEAQAVAKVVTDALWKRTPQGLGTYSHSFSQLIGALVHGIFRGFNVHEIEWENDGTMVYPVCFYQLPAQYMRWEDRAGHPDKLLFIKDGETAEAKPFPAHKYIVALNTSGPDHPIYNASYYSLVAWFGAFKFGLGWFMEYCQKYGLPKLVFHYDSPADRKQLEKDLAEERVLNNILLKGDRAVDIANAPASGASLPQRELLNLAESACHKLILGQTLTSDTSEHGGSLAQAKVHAGVQADIVKKRADYVADVLNAQLIPAIVLLNYGTLDVPMPELRFKVPQEGVTLERVQVVKTALEIKGMKLKKSEVYEFTGFAQPAEGDDVFEAASEEAAQGGFGALFGQEPPPGGKGPQKGRQEPAKDAEPVSAAKADAPSDPAQEWLAPIKQKFLEARKNGASMAELRKMLLTMHPNTKALARAFANNILAGFAGESEEVDAANPYGCNQYGEGWKMPHNGMQSKPGAPIKKNNPTEKGENDDEGSQIIEKKENKKNPIGEAATREEAIGHTKSLLPKERNTRVHFDPSLPLSIINSYNKALKEMIDKYPTPYLVDLGSIYDPDDGTMALADHGALRINPDDKRFGIRMVGKLHKQPQVNKPGFSRELVAMTKHPNEQMKATIAHEYGHVVLMTVKENAKDWRSPNEQKFKEAVKAVRSAYRKARNNGDIKKISSYAHEDEDEFFSECLSARETGEKLPDYINNALDKVLKISNMK